MKSLSIILATALGLFAFAPAAQAGHKSCHSPSHRTSACGYCDGYVTYVKRFVGYDCHGCPIYRWVATPHVCRSHDRKPSCDHNHDSRHRHSAGVSVSGPGFRLSFRR